MRLHRTRARGRIGISAHIGFGGNVTQRVIADGLGRVARAGRGAGRTHGIIGKPVQAVVAEILRIALVVVGPVGQIADLSAEARRAKADRVLLIGEVRRGAVAGAGIGWAQMAAKFPSQR